MRPYVPHALRAEVDHSWRIYLPTLPCSVGREVVNVEIFTFFLQRVIHLWGFVIMYVRIVHLWTSSGASVHFETKRLDQPWLEFLSHIELRVF